MIAPWIIAVIVSVVLNVAAMVLTPRPKGPRPDSVQEADNPKASAGSPIFVVFGTVTVKEVNVLGYWDKSTRTQEVKA